HAARGAGGAEAVVPGGRRGDGRELEQDLRRGGCGPDRKRGGLLAARIRAPGPVCLVRPRGRRSATDVAREPGGLRARAGAGRARLDDMAVIEVNEAFASVALQFLRDAGLEERAVDVNPNGGGISLGHPL